MHLADLHHLLLVYAAYVVAVASPGPSTMAIMGDAMRDGRAPAVVLALGVMTGSLFWAALAGAGLATLLTAWIIATVTRPLRQLTWAVASISRDGLEDGATAFIKALEQEAVESLTDPAKARPERVKAFRQLFEEKFAVAVIGKWTLGRNWRRASAEEQKEFLQLFEDLMVAMYVDRFENYAGEKLNILKKNMLR